MSKRKASTLDVKSYNTEPSVGIAAFFNGFDLENSDAQFQLYKKKHGKSYVLHGESETLHYDGATKPEDDMSQYIVAAYDPTTKSLELFESPPIIEAQVVSKKKIIYNGPKIAQADISYAMKRNALGQEFGTKKAKKAIASVSQNRIESEKLEHNQHEIVEDVKVSTEALPTSQEMEGQVQQDRPTPQCVADATNVESVYPIHNIVPRKEWNMIKLESLLSEESAKKKLEFFPYKDSRFVSERVGALKSASQLDKLKLVYYVSLLMGVYFNKRSANNKLKLLEALNSPAEILIDGVLERFAISKTSQFGRSKDRSFVIDPYHEDKLLCYMLTCILHVDNFVVQIQPLANELSIKPSRLVSLFRALGCTVKPATVTQGEMFNIPKSALSTYKIATLKVPFKEPVMVRRGRR